MYHDNSYWIFFENIRFTTVLWSIFVLYVLSYFSVGKSRLQESFILVIRQMSLLLKLQKPRYSVMFQNEGAADNHHAGISRVWLSRFQIYPQGKRPQEHQSCPGVFNSTKQLGLVFCSSEAVQQYEQEKTNPLHGNENFTVSKHQILNDFRLILKVHIFESVHFSAITRNSIRQQESQMCPETHKHACSLLSSKRKHSVHFAALFIHCSLCSVVQNEERGSLDLLITQ